MTWIGGDPVNTTEHLCGRLHGPGGAYVSAYWQLTCAPTGRPSVGAALGASLGKPGPGGEAA